MWHQAVTCEMNELLSSAGCQDCVAVSVRATEIVNELNNMTSYKIIKNLIYILKIKIITI